MTIGTTTTSSLRRSERSRSRRFAASSTDPTATARLSTTSILTAKTSRPSVAVSTIKPSGSRSPMDTPEGFRVSFPGPFSAHDVVFEGWRVPFLHAHPAGDNDRIMLVIDGRLAETFTTAEAEKVVPFLADAIGCRARLHLCAARRR